MDTKTLAILGIGGAALWYVMQQSSAAAPVATAPTAQPKPLLNAQQQAIGQFLQSVGSQGPTLLATAARASVPASGTLTPSQWGYFFKIVSGMTDPDLTGYLPSGLQQVTLNQFWSAIAAYAGGAAPANVSLNGLGCGFAQGLAGAQTLKQPSWGW